MLFVNDLAHQSCRHKPILRDPRLQAEPFEVEAITCPLCTPPLPQDEDFWDQTLEVVIRSKDQEVILASITPEKGAWKDVVCYFGLDRDYQLTMDASSGILGRILPPQDEDNNFWGRLHRKISRAIGLLHFIHKKRQERGRR